MVDNIISTSQPLFPCSNASLSLFYSYFHCKCSAELYPVQTFTAQPLLTMSPGLHHFHSLCIQLTRRIFHSEVFFPRTTTLWNGLLCGCFHKYLNLFNSVIPILHFLPPPLMLISDSSFSNPLP